ncbi:MAG: TlyA family RNA methyltransferase [Verrucomicrobiaceae bacterium]|nr:TlyA family RNA methyltransferase [Verrucomicrobiaceae bacterium]
MARIRLDQALVQKALCPSREQAKRLILAGEVSVDGHPATKPGLLVAEEADLRVKTPPKFVSRGGLKLEGALDRFAIDVAGKVCLDIGSSTGGFTDCLLQRGARKVFAFDVGTNQLAWKLRSDPRVVSREHFNVRHMQPQDVGETVDVLVADVSFISLALVLPAALAVVKPGGDCIVLVKPQFELSREEVGRGGIVREPALHQKACAKIESFVRGDSRLEWKHLMASPVTGADGNHEFLAWFKIRPVP